MNAKFTNDIHEIKEGDLIIRKEGSEVIYVKSKIHKYSGCYRVKGRILNKYNGTEPFEEEMTTGNDYLVIRESEHTQLGDLD